MQINIWIALRDDAQSLIKTRLKWNEETQGAYTGPVSNRQAKLFALMADSDNTQRLFRVDRTAGRDWAVWSVYFDFKKDALIKIKEELDSLIAGSPNRVKILGAWHFDGREVMQAGSPAYPQHPRLIEFMPDDVSYDANSNETSRTRPTVPSDVNLLLGQSPRVFS